MIRDERAEMERDIKVTFSSLHKGSSFTPNLEVILNYILVLQREVGIARFLFSPCSGNEHSALAYRWPLRCRRYLCCHSSTTRLRRTGGLFVVVDIYAVIQARNGSTREETNSLQLYLLKDFEVHVRM
ncbi:hypothetical protein F0562_008337 [Nyssa sinensis]|uniref:Uncharacterized protein n=1 Tax=Nyssa sinensis TaxID=561372 RepID=A0A5J5A7K2_9ASTE|nr:hypothetical protein F0562_008337 [Nyssa sinensis]